MSDQRLRELERRRGASTDDEAAWLAERLRAGSLTRARLDLAAWCGHEAAVRAGGTPGPDDVAAWVRGLEPHHAALALWALAEVLGGAGEPPEPPGSALGRLSAGAREAFLRDELRGWTDRELSDRTHLATARGAGERRLFFAMHHVARDPRAGDPTDPDVLRALESVRPRFPYLDPGSWSYAWSERRHGVWTHRLRYVRVKGGESSQLVDAAPGWAPPPDAPWAGPRALDGLLLGADQVRPAVIVEAAIPWALRGPGSS